MHGNKYKLFTLIFMLLLFSFISCSNKDDENISANNYNRITCVFPREDSGFWNELNLGLANQVNRNPFIDMKTYYHVISKSLDEMIFDLKYACAANVDVIVAADKTENEEYKEAIDYVKKQGIIVIIINPEFFQFKETSQIGNTIYNQIFSELEKRESGRMINEIY